jgi:cephalosporin hydroxylase
MLDDPVKNTFLGVPCLQFWKDLMLWERFLQTHKLGALVEVGSYKGGLSLFLRLQCCQRAIQFLACDLKLMDAAHTLVGELLALDDVFEETSYTEPRFVRQVLEMNPPRLVLCDDGDKPTETRFWAERLLSGDYIAVHDWGQEIKAEHIPPQLIPVMNVEAESIESWTRWFRVP